MQTKLFLLALISIIVSSCQTHFHSGTLITEDQINLVTNTTISKSEVEEKFGTANIIPNFSPNTWYYVYRNMSKRAFFNPKIESQRIVKLIFSQDKLASIEAIDNQHNSEIRVIDEFIRTQGTELNPIQEYIGNIGRFHKHNKKDSRR